jgi:transportin-3
MFAGSVIILSQLPHEQITTGMRQLCAMQAEPLIKVMAEEAGRPIPGVPQRDPAVWLDRLAAVFRNCTPKVKHGAVHPCQSVIMETWPVLSSVCEKYQADVRIIERCCRCIRYAVRCLGKHSSDLLSPLVTQMVMVYSSHPHSCFLYLGAMLVDEYGKEECWVQGLGQMLEAFCNPTFALLEKNTLRNHPDTVDDLFRLCLRFIQQAPIAFLTSTVQQNLMRVAIAAATLDHKDANASVTKFLTELVKAAYCKPDHKEFQARSKLAKALLNEMGQSLTAALLNSSLFSLPTFMIADTAEVLYEMIQVDKKVSFYSYGSS